MSTPHLRLIHHTEILEERAGTEQTLNLINNFRKIFFVQKNFSQPCMFLNLLTEVQEFIIIFFFKFNKNSFYDFTTLV